MVEQTDAERADDTGVHVRIGTRELSLALSEEHVIALKSLAERIGREPFTKRPWSELAFFLVSGGLAGIGLAFVGFTMVAGVVLAITFFGLALLALSLRSARGMGGWQRGLARSMLGEAVEDPEPFAGRRGFLGWLQSSLRDRVGWHAVAYFAIKVPWTLLGVFVAVSLWWDAFACLTGPFFNRDGGGLQVWGLAAVSFRAANTGSSRRASSTRSASSSSAPSSSSPRRGHARLRQRRPSPDPRSVGPDPWPPGSARSSTPGPRRSTPRRPRCGASSVTCTTAPRALTRRIRKATPSPCRSLGFASPFGDRATHVPNEKYDE